MGERNKEERAEIQAQYSTDMVRLRCHNEYLLLLFSISIHELASPYGTILYQYLSNQKTTGKDYVAGSADH